MHELRVTHTRGNAIVSCSCGQRLTVIRSYSPGFEREVRRIHNAHTAERLTFQLAASFNERRGA